ncbi:MAG: hypothetical protein KJO95_13320 [Gammaproteobacteria bacterium]|nr:hypothetical protein [Gammaproteobacteria bacterium]MBU2675622.1 hypothetical protein [Gammaproteobacteria bacterium]NNC56579.1 hypothetical protein [Woeseiaceae bacterium]NNL49357.1 hypothetical protein [Woeseiaceae bacterium]
MKYRIITVTAAAFVLAGTGCATKDGTENDFGNSVRQMTEQQIFDMNAASSPDPNAVLGGDPERLNNTLDGHRKDVAKPSGVAAPVTINVGN